MDDNKRGEDIREVKRKLAELQKLVDRLDENPYAHIEGEHVQRSSKNNDKGYVRILVSLIIILLVVDVLSLVAFYRPNFSMSNNQSTSNTPKDNTNTNSNANCADGTPNNSCSKNKPQFCYNGQLVKNAKVCGCPVGYIRDFQDCKQA